MLLTRIEIQITIKNNNLLKLKVNSNFILSIIMRLHRFNSALKELTNL